MKPSYFSTPRAMSEAVWRLDCDPIEPPVFASDRHASAVVAGALVLGALTVICVFAGWL